MWKKLRQPLSAKQMAASAGLVVVVGAAVYGLWRGGAALWHRRQLERAIPAALEGVRGQREALLQAIEAYKSRFGYYPPLLTAAGPTRGIINPLYYELFGVRFDARSAQFYLPGSKDGLAAAEVQEFFSMGSFSNCLAFPNVPTNFLANRPLGAVLLSREPELFGVAPGYTTFTPEAFWDDFEFTPWRYLTNPAEHNPGRFDVWVELRVAGKHFTIGNWPEVE